MEQPHKISGEETLTKFINEQVAREFENSKRDLIAELFELGFTIEQSITILEFTEKLPIIISNGIKNTDIHIYQGYIIIESNSLKISS